MEEFNEQAAIDFIRQNLSDEASARINDDEILNVIDMIWDFYDENGLLDIDFDDDADDDVDIDALVAYVRKMVAKDKKSPIKADDVDVIVKAELEYEQQNDLL